MKIHFMSSGGRAPAGVTSFARRAIGRVLASVRGAVEVNVVWTSRRRLRSLGKRFRHADQFTDVISFRYDNDVPSVPAEARPFGDLFISPDQARINARRFGVSLREECVRLCVHGALHLLGYRDYTPSERKRMWAVQEDVVRRTLKT